MRAEVITLAAVLVAGVSFTAHAQQPQRAQEGLNSPEPNMRFAEMDTNKDGVISRREWRGSNASFTVHDWDGDGVLSREEVRTAARRPARQAPPDDFDDFDREYVYNDWTEQGFRTLDHNGDGRVSRDEWHFAQEPFVRADHNRDGVLSRGEFLGGEDPAEDDDRDDTFWNLDENNDGRVTRGEWHGSRARFDALDVDRNGVLSRTELGSPADAPPDLYSSLDINKDGAITPNEWHWPRGGFDQRDANRDGRITREELARTGGGATAQQSQVHRSGYERGLADGRKAGLQDRSNRWGWALEGRPEMANADAGYQASMNARIEYQTGYRDGFRTGYRAGYEGK